MTTTDTAPNPPRPPAAQRRLRRSRTDRVGAGVAAGLGDYFGVDPVLFRVLFAASAFFGGAGIIAYLIAWVAIPEDGEGRAAVDSWIGELRRRHVPPWVVAVATGAVLWVAAFSWWTPAPFWPVLVVVVVLVTLYGRRSSRRRESVTGSPAVDLRKSTSTQPESTDPAAATSAPEPLNPPWAGEARAWIAERRTAARERRRRSFPVRIATLIAIAVALIVLASIDSAHGIALPLYFVFVGGLAVLGLLVGLASRRTPWSLSGLIILSLLGLLAFGTTSASLRDGVGQRTWDPTGTPATSYRLAFGTGTLDLRDLRAQDRPRTVHITMAAGQVRVLAPRTMNLTVSANVHAGNVAVDTQVLRDGDGGVEYNRIVRPPPGATGQPIRVVIRLADGNIDVRRR